MISILYICTHNRCRSILSEAITNKLGDQKLKAYSAGSSPSGQVHPLSIQYLQEHGYETEGLKSQSWDEFSPDLLDEGIDISITVCDQAAQEACPVWFGKQVKLHWGLADPSKVEGSEEDQKVAFDACIKEIEARVQKMLSFDTSDRESFIAQIKESLA